VYARVCDYGSFCLIINAFFGAVNTINKFGVCLRVSSSLSLSASCLFQKLFLGLGS
jgi:hypothetical protein